MEENNKGFCSMHHERTQDIKEIKDELKEGRKDLKEVASEIYTLELKIDAKLDNKVNWSTFKWVIAGMSCIMMFLLGTQVTVLVKKEDLMSRSDFQQWKDERNVRLDRIEDRMLAEMKIVRDEIKELKDMKKK